MSPGTLLSQHAASTLASPTLLPLRTSHCLLQAQHEHPSPVPAPWLHGCQPKPGELRTLTGQEALSSGLPTEPRQHQSTTPMYSAFPCFYIHAPECAHTCVYGFIRAYFPSLSHEHKAPRHSSVWKSTDRWCLQTQELSIPTAQS